MGGKNPLPTSYEITFNNPESVKSAAVSVKAVKGGESTHYGQDSIEQLFKIANVLGKVNCIDQINVDVVLSTVALCLCWLVV